MIKKVYSINGFDCANCAAKTESFLNHDSRIEYARIDFAGNRLYITYKDKELTIDEILELVKKVEPNGIQISASTNKIKTEKFLTTKIIILLIRIVISTVLMFVAKFAIDQNSYIAFAIYLIAIFIIGYDVFYKVLYKIIKLKNPINEFLLITIAVIGVIIISFAFPDPKERFEGYFDATMVIVLFQIGQIIEHYATNKSKNSIATAVDTRTKTANLFDGIDTKVVNSESLKVGDLIIVKTGDIVPVDSILIEGEGTLDISSLTGEFVPKVAKVNEEILSGYLVKSGTLTLQVKKTFNDSTVSKILELVSNSGEHKSKAENFVSKFAKWYTPSVLIVAFLFAVIYGGITFANGIDNAWSKAINTALELIIIACPCAIVISVPMCYFAGIGLASKHGIIIKGGNYLDELCNLKKLITDKTGTLTHGAFMITKSNPINISNEKFNEYLYASECLSNHPIGKAIIHGNKNKNVISKIKDFYEIPGKGTKCIYNDENIIAGSRQFLISEGINIEEVQDLGTIVYLAVNKKYIGYVVLSDELKEDAQPMVDLLHDAGIEIVLLTGDKEEIASSTCKELGIDRWHSELLPSEKTKYLEMEMSNSKKKVAFIGDGINDAPSIMRSDIGIAMGGIGSDAAVSNADVVIMNDNPAKVYDAYKIAKMTRRRAWFCVVFSLFVKLSVMIAAILVLQITHKNMPKSYAVIADTGLTVLMIICAFILLYQKVHRPKHIK